MRSVASQMFCELPLNKAALALAVKTFVKSVPARRYRLLSARVMKLFFFRLKDDYSRFDETNFSTWTARARARTASGKAKEMVPDGFLSSLAWSRENNELWGASISCNLPPRRAPPTLTRDPSRCSPFSFPSPSFCLRPQNQIHPIFALSFVFRCGDLQAPDDRVILKPAKPRDFSYLTARRTERCLVAAWRSAGVLCTSQKNSVEFSINLPTKH